MASGNVLVNKAAGSYRSQGAVAPACTSAASSSLYFRATIDQSGVGVFYSIGTADVMVAQ